MKKIAIPIFLAVTILTCAWYVGAKTISQPNPPNNPILIGGNTLTPGKPIVTSSGPLTMTLSNNNGNILHGSNGDVTLQFDIEAIKSELNKSDRGPLNIALVIDRSGSMADKGKLDYALIAAQDLVDRLDKSDRLAVIIYDDVAEVLVPSTAVTDPVTIKKRIAEVASRGSTNLGGGLALGHDEVNKYFDREAVNQVVILSDGLANQGITDPTQLRQLVGAWSEKGIRVTTMGLGTDFNEDLMMSLANASGGHYYFIESPTQLAAIYEKELMTLMQTVAKDVKIQLQLADGVQFKNVYGYDAKVEGSKLTISLGDFNSGQHRLVMLHLQAPAGNIGKVGVAAVELTYANALADSKKITDSAKVAVNCIEDVAAVEKTRNLNVEGNGYWFGNSNEKEQTIQKVQEGKKEDAVKWYEQKIDDIRSANKVYNNDQLEAQAKGYEEELDKLKTVNSPSDEGGRAFVIDSKARQRLDSQGYLK